MIDIFHVHTSRMKEMLNNVADTESDHFVYPDYLLNVAINN